MIRIRYCDPSQLPAWYHADAVQTHGRRVTVYLLAGLTARQRKAALARLQLAGRMGRGPRLPGGQLRAALAVAWVTAAVRQVRVAFRLHPAGLQPAPAWPAVTLPGIVAAAAAVLFAVLFLTTVSFHVVHRAPRAAGLPAAAGVMPVVPGTAPPMTGPLRRPRPGSAGPGRGQVPLRPVPARHPSGWPAEPSGGPGLAGTGSPAPAAGVTPAEPAPSATATSGGTCVTVGPLGVCVTI